MIPEEVANLLDEFFFLAIKYYMVGEKGEAYDRLEKNSFIRVLRQNKRSNDIALTQQTS